MRVVPNDSLIEIEAYLPNSDVGFVSVGQEAVIKVEAFPFTRFGVVSGHVTAVATDAIPQPDADTREGQPTKGIDSIIPIGNVQRVQNLVFPVTVKPDVSTIKVNGKVLPLSAGMAATVEVNRKTSHPGIPLLSARGSYVGSNAGKVNFAELK